MQIAHLATSGSHLAIEFLIECMVLANGPHSLIKSSTIALTGSQGNRTARYQRFFLDYSKE
jgi:hypothetical protein